MIGNVTGLNPFSSATTGRGALSTALNMAQSPLGSLVNQGAQMGATAGQMLSAVPGAIAGRLFQPISLINNVVGGGLAGVAGQGTADVATDLGFGEDVAQGFGTQGMELGQVPGTLTGNLAGYASEITGLGNLSSAAGYNEDIQTAIAADVAAGLDPQYGGVMAPGSAPIGSALDSPTGIVPVSTSMSGSDIGLGNAPAAEGTPGAVSQGGLFSGGFSAPQGVAPQTSNAGGSEGDIGGTGFGDAEDGSSGDDPTGEHGQAGLGAAGLAGGGGCCFPAGTVIEMADGTTMKIEDVGVGDEVLSYEPLKEQNEVGTVKRLRRPVRDAIYTLKFKSGRVLRLTDDHPIYTKNGWAAIDHIKANLNYSYRNVKPLFLEIEVLTFDSKWDQIVGVQIERGEIQTYTLAEVSPANTFYADGFVVSNGGGC
jgi:hypothetical protein